MLIGLIAVPLALVGVTGLGDLVRRARAQPVSSRGLVLAVDVPPAPPAWTGRVSRWTLDIVVSMVAVWFVSPVMPPIEIIVVCLAIVVALAPPVLALRALATGLRRARRLGADRMTAVSSGRYASALLSGSEHVYAPADTLPLDAVCTAADAAVTDIPAALSSLLATGIPVAVTNPAGLSEAALRHRFPTTATTYVVDPDGDGIDLLVAAARGDDALALDRDRARDVIVGPPDPGAERFTAAVERALQRSRGHGG